MIIALFTCQFVLGQEPDSVPDAAGAHVGGETEEDGARVRNFSEEVDFVLLQGRFVLRKRLVPPVELRERSDDQQIGRFRSGLVSNRTAMLNAKWT